MNKRLHIFFVFIGLVQFPAIALHAQSNQDSIISSYIKDLTKIWDNYNAYSFDSYISDSSMKGTTNLFSIADNFNFKRKDLLLQSNLIQQRITKSDYGLQFSGAYQENFSAPFVDPEDVVVFKRKLQLGIDWDILKTGYYQNRLKLKMLRNDFKALEQKSFVNNLTRFQLQNTQQILFFFNQKKIEVLKKREEMIKEQIIVDEKLYALKHLTRDDYIKTLQHSTDVNGQIKLYKAFNTASTELVNPSDYEFPVLDIDIAKLFESANLSDIDTSYIYEIENQKIQNSFLNDISLRTSLKYNYYDVYTNNIPNRSFLSLNVSFAVPLTFNYKARKELLAVKSDILKEDNKGDGNEIQFILLNHFYEYRYKMKQYYNMVLKRNVFGELVRTERVKRELSDLEFNPNTAIYILDDYWSNTIELLDIRQEMYKILLAIKMKVPQANISEYTKPAKASDYINLNTKKFRGIYIWSKAFKNYENNVIAEYCLLNEFNPLLISFKNEREYIARLKSFINKNYTSDIHLMIGQNKLINGGIETFLDTIKQLMPMKFIKGIHLDIEPHTFDDFKENKEAYFEKYTALLQKAKTYAVANKLELSVSIPLHYPEDVLKTIFNLCDKVYLMAYENVTVEHIVKKTAEEMALGKDKVVLALRTKDFENREQMDAHFTKLGFTKICYHDFDYLREFDNKSINAIDKKEGQK